MMRKPLLGISHEFDGSLHSAKSPSLYLQCKREDGSAALFIFTHENRRDSLGPTDDYEAQQVVSYLEWPKGGREREE